MTLLEGVNGWGGLNLEGTDGLSTLPKGGIEPMGGIDPIGCPMVGIEGLHTSPGLV